MLRVESIILVPLIAALLVSLVPNSDVRTRSSLSTALQLGWLGLITFLGYQGILSQIHLALLLVQNLVLVGVRFHKNTPSLLPPMSWLLTSLSTAAILSAHLDILIILAYLHIAFLMFVLAQTGGLYKGSSTYEAFLFFVVIDLSALFALSFPNPWVYWILILPGLARILFAFTAPYARRLFVNSPTEIMLLMLGGSVPIGIIWLLQIPLPCPDREFLEMMTLGSCFFAAVLFTIEKSRRQRAIYLFMTQSALSARLILGAYPEKTKLLGGLLCLVALVNSAIWLYWLETPKIRIFNMALAALTLFFLVVQP